MSALSDQATPCYLATTPLRGEVTVPGDKSIGHRAFLFGALCDGTVEVTGLSDGEDNQATARALAQMGVQIERFGTSARVHGVGLHGLKAPDGPIDCGNSGTTMRLLLGILAGQPFEVELVGDHSLTRRPMKRVLAPLSQMGLEVVSVREGTYPPLRVKGSRQLKGIHYQSPVASAQVKSAVLLAGLYADSETRVQEPAVSRDHTERMLAYLREGNRLIARPIDVPGDLSSAAFLLGAALIVPGSEVTIRGVGVNPTRTGVLDALLAMGAEIQLAHLREVGGEPVADLHVRFGPLKACRIDGELTVRAIDELPLLATLAAFAEGATSIRDAHELRVKESDRIAKTAELLRAFGVEVLEYEDGLDVVGQPGRTLRQGLVAADGDHRIAMCANLLGLLSPGSAVLGAHTIASSFPAFFATLAALGAKAASPSV